MITSIIVFVGLLSASSAQPCICPAIFDPVCCNGQQYSSGCQARCAGCTDADISDGPCPAPGDVCGSPPDDCLALRCLCGICPDGVSQFGCCSDCVLDDELNCQSISSCPDGCADTKCDESNQEWCVENPFGGASCTSCAAITCIDTQACVYGVGCQDVDTCGDTGTACDEEAGEWCYKDQCTTCRDFNCPNNQECEFGIGCQQILTCANVLCSSDKPYCIFDDVNGPRCVGVCECNTDDDCEDGFICNETPVGFAGCSDATDSCFGFCSNATGTCGGFVNEQCDDPAECILPDNGGTLGTCYEIQETCDNPTIETTSSLPRCGTRDVVCQIGEKCIDDPIRGGICVDIDVCCDPQEIIDNPDICQEGCQCCPDGTWSGSIGDADTFCGGLQVSAGDTFGDICEDDDGDSLKKCTSNGRNSECSKGYKCRTNPNCKGTGKCNPRRVCLDIDGSCSDDSDCDVYNGYSCVGDQPNGKGRGRGRGNGYGNNNRNGQCIKFEDP